jgi:hypothetical protein
MIAMGGNRRAGDCPEVRGLVHFSASRLRLGRESRPENMGLTPSRSTVAASLALAGLVLAAGLAGCAGYRVGAASLFPSGIQTVYVPVFESDSFRRGLGERLTEAVCKELERRSPYKIVNDEAADSVLSGRIVGDQKQTLVSTLNGDIRESQVTLNVKVTWVDRRGAPLRNEVNVPLPPEVADVQGSSTVTPEVGQSLVAAQQQAIQRVAQQIVNLMEVMW